MSEVERAEEVIDGPRERERKDWRRGVRRRDMGVWVAIVAAAMWVGNGEKWWVEAGDVVDEARDKFPHGLMGHHVHWWSEAKGPETQIHFDLNVKSSPSIEDFI